MNIKIRFFLLVLSSFVAGFFVENGTGSIKTQNLILFAILLLGLIFIFRLYSSRFTNNFDLFFYISILFSIYIFYYFLRIYLLSRLGLFYSNVSFLILSVLPEALPLPGPSSLAHSSPSTEDSFGIQVISEPWPIIQNLSLESSMQARIGVLENANSIFLLDQERGQYWADVKETLNQAPSQQEYNRLLEFENRDLQIREKKHECYSLFQGMLSKNPALAENAPYNPSESCVDFFSSNREELDNPQKGLTPEQRDRLEVQFLDAVAKDIRKHGPDSTYMKKMLGYTDS